MTMKIISKPYFSIENVRNVLLLLTWCCLGVLYVMLLDTRRTVKNNDVIMKARYDTASMERQIIINKLDSLKFHSHNPS